MPTSDSRRFLPSARRACASLVTTGLVLGLAVTAAGATPIPATTSGRTGAVVGTATESLDPTFVQEGMPSTNGGQVVRWGDLGGTNSPPALPPGVFATAVTSDSSSTVLVLRSDGHVDSHHYTNSPVVTRHLQAPPNTRYTAVSTDEGVGEHLLRSDGVVVDLSGQVVTTPPEGLTYTAIAPGLALRSDGVLGPSGTPEMTCPDASDPGPGFRYTAVSASFSHWVALRDDGAFVYCRPGNEGAQATVFEPPAGTHFIGVDMGQVEAVAATADGRVISSENGLVAVAPTGRSIVSLAAIRYGQGAAALDDGMILSWDSAAKTRPHPWFPPGVQSSQQSPAKGITVSTGRSWSATPSRLRCPSSRRCLPTVRCVSRIMSESMSLQHSQTERRSLVWQRPLCGLPTDRSARSRQRGCGPPLRTSTSCPASTRRSEATTWP